MAPGQHLLPTQSATTRKLSPVQKVRTKAMARGTRNAVYVRSNRVMKTPQAKAALPRGSTTGSKRSDRRCLHDLTHTALAGIGGHSC
jgi:hypothetical protein